MEQAIGEPARILRRIAAALGIPVEALFHGGAERPSAEELVALIRLYEAITDPVLRRRCLDQVRAAAEACTGTGAREGA